VSPQAVTALLGIAIEPLEDIMRQVSSLPSAVATRRDPATDATLLAEKIVKHLFNYLSGFAGGTALTPEVTIPIGTIVRWYESFISKVKNSGIGFLENQES
jgi:protein Hikeshi